MECSPARDLRFFGRPGGIKPNWSTGARAGTRPCAHARVEQLYDLPCGPLPAPLRKRMGPKRQKGGAGGSEKDRHPGAFETRDSGQRNIGHTRLRILHFIPAFKNDGDTFR
jgi:hypothetical protein